MKIWPVFIRPKKASEIILHITSKNGESTVIFKIENRHEIPQMKRPVALWQHSILKL